MGVVRIYQLTSGADVLGEVVTDVEEYIVLKQPQVLILQPNGQGGMGVQFIPFFPYTKNKQVTIPRSAIVINESPDPELSNQYNTMFGSGILIAPAGAMPQTESDGRGGMINTRII